MIKVSGMHKSYRTVKAVQDVSLEIREGEIFGILGPNGCGKTTIIKAILGLVVPGNGAVEVDGRQVARNWDYRSRVGYMPQNADFPANLEVSELLDMIEDIRDTKSRRRTELTELFELGPHLGKKFGTLSGGTKQKVAAVGAFMYEPSILVLDEPTVGLDPLAAVRLKQLIAERRKAGGTILLVTHMLTEIEQLVDRMTLLVDGRSRFQGNLSELMAHTESSSAEAAIVRLMERTRA